MPCFGPRARPAPSAARPTRRSRALPLTDNGVKPVAESCFCGYKDHMGRESGHSWPHLPRVLMISALPTSDPHTAAAGRWTTFPSMPRSFPPSFRPFLRPRTTFPRERSPGEMLGDAVLSSASMLRKRSEGEGKRERICQPTEVRPRSPVRLYSFRHPRCHRLTPELMSQIPSGLPADLRTVWQLESKCKMGIVLDPASLFLRISLKKITN